MSDLSAIDARRITLDAMGFTQPRPSRVDIRHVRKVLHRLKAIQIDSVNVAVRAHYMPLFSRLGPYRMGLLDELVYGRKEAFEYWGHALSYMPTDFVPFFRYRMAAVEPWDRLKKVIRSHGWSYINSLADEVRRRGPLLVSDLEDGGERTGPWWGHSRGKTALEWLYDKGVLGVTDRVNFARVYDLFENTVPLKHHEAPHLDQAEAQQRLTLEALSALGVATAAEISDYFRFRPQDGRAAIEALAAAGDIRQVAVEGWAKPGYVLAGRRLPRKRSGASALLTPFDNLIWHRDRTERIFGFRYRIEIYVPEAEREYGYYVLPFLMDEDLVARVDLKADRKAGTLQVKGAWVEKGADHDEVAVRLGGELALMAPWLGLSDISVGRKGNLANALRKRL